MLQAWRPSSELMTELLPQPEMPSSITVQVKGRSDSAPEEACTMEQQSLQLLPTMLYIAVVFGSIVNTMALARSEWMSEWRKTRG